MTIDQGIDWALRIVMVLLTFWVFLWGKSAKKDEALLLAQFALRDQILRDILARLDHAGQKASDAADRVMVKLNDHSERIAVLEILDKDRRTREADRRLGAEDRRHHDDPA